MTITEASKKFGLSSDTLRYYEKIGLLPNVSRNKNGIRIYSNEDCRWIEFIKCMRNAGLSIESLSKYIILFHEGDKTINERKNLLKDQMELLLEKKKSIDETIMRLEYKINNYEKILSKSQKLNRKML